MKTITLELTDQEERLLKVHVLRDLTIPSENIYSIKDGEMYNLLAKLYNLVTDIEENKIKMR